MVAGTRQKDPRWITYKQASSIGAQVRRGEKGTVVEYWQFTEEVPKTDEKGQEIIGQDGKPEKETVRLERPKVFHAVVFNGEQIDGLPPLKLRPLSWNPDERAENILKNSGAVIDHRHGDRAFYSPSRDSITLPLREQFESPGAYYETALHELGHWTGHADRLNRDLSHPFGSEGYAREELRAEIASLMLSQELGVSFNPGQHASYVASWIMVLQDDPMEIMRAASDAEKIQGYVMAFDQVREIEQQNEAAVSISDRQNIDEASLAEEKNLINAVDKNDVAAIINFMAEEKMHEGLKRFSLVISEMDDATFQNAFWQRHQKPENGESFMENLNAAKEALDEAIEQSSYRTVEEQIRQFLPEQDKESVRVVSDERVYVQIPYADREQAKMLGAKWDKEEKSWYIPPGVNQEPFRKWLDSATNQAKTVTDNTPAIAKTLIDVPFREKNEARALGAKWDKDQKSWYIPEGVNTALFARWMQPKQEALAERPCRTILLRKKQLSVRSQPYSKSIRLPKQKKHRQKKTHPVFILPFRMKKKKRLKPLVPNGTKPTNLGLWKAVTLIYRPRQNGCRKSNRLKACPRCRRWKSLPTSCAKWGVWWLMGIRLWTDKNTESKPSATKKASAAAFMLVIWTAPGRLHQKQPDGSGG